MTRQSKLNKNIVEFFGLNLITTWKCKSGNSIPRPMASELFMILNLLQESVNILQQSRSLKLVDYFCNSYTLETLIMKLESFNWNRFKTNSRCFYNYFQLSINKFAWKIWFRITWYISYHPTNFPSWDTLLSWVAKQLTPREHHRRASSHHLYLHMWVHTRSHAEDQLIDSHSTHLG